MTTQHPQPTGAEYPQSVPGGMPAGTPQQGPYLEPGAYLPAAPPVPEKPKGGKVRLIVGIAIAVVLGGLGLFYALSQFDVHGAKVGDCLAQVSENEVKSVQCDSAEAQYTVISIVENQPETTDATDPCADVAAAEASYWEGAPGGNGRVLCLQER